MADIFLNNNNNNNNNNNSNNNDNNNNNNDNNNGLLTDPQIFSSYSYLGQPVLLGHISVYCWEQISCCCCPGQGRVVLARQGKTLLKSDSSLRV